MSPINSYFKKITPKSLIIIGVTLLCGYLIYFQLFPKIIIDNYVKNKIVAAFTKANPDYELHISHLQFKLFENRLTFNSIFKRQILKLVLMGTTLPVISFRNIITLKLQC